MNPGPPQTPLSRGSTGSASDPTPHVPDHELLRRIGVGSYGEVWLARSVTSAYRAVKVVYRQHFDHDRPYEREFSGIQKFEPVSRTHESQIDILHVGRNDKEGYFYYVMELADDASSEIRNPKSEIRNHEADVTPWHVTAPEPMSEAQEENKQTGKQEDKTDARGDGVGERWSDGEKAAAQHSSNPALHHSTAPAIQNPDSYQPKTLRSELQRRGRLPLAECLRIGLSLTSALEHLHRHGLVHRDIKPSNIIFVGGIPKMADPGLVADVGKTMSFVGTEGYLPPEGPGSPQADLYSLGKVLYEISTGKDRQEFPELPTDLEELREEEALLEFNEVLVKACRLEARGRYPNAAAMHEDLLLVQRGKSVVRVHKLERRLALATKIGLAALAAAAITAGAFYEARRAAKVATESLVRLSVSQGAHLLEEGDLFGSLVRFTEALRLERRGAKREAVHRLRIGTLLSQCPKLNHVWFHNDVVNFAEFSRDGRWVITASQDGRARVWSADTGEVISAWMRHSSGIVHAVFSPDGTRALTCCRDGTAQIWDLPSGRPSTPPLKHGYPVWNGEFSPDSQRVVTVSGTTTATPRYGEAIVWSALTGEPLIKLSQDLVRKAYFSPDGGRLLTAHDDKTALLWDANTGRLIAPPMVHPAGVRVGAFSLDGKRVATVCRHATGARVWNAFTGEPVTPFMRHEAEVQWVGLSPDGRQVVTSSKDGTARVWDAATGEPALPPLRHIEEVPFVTFSPDGRHLLTVCEDLAVRLWDAKTGQLAYPPLKAGGHVLEAGFSPEGRRVVAASRDNLVRLWQLPRAGQPLVLESASALKEIAYVDNGKRVVTWGLDGVELRKAQDGQLIRSYRFAQSRPDTRIYSVGTSSDGKHFHSVRSYPGPQGAQVWETVFWDKESGRQTVIPMSYVTNGFGYLGTFVWSMDLARVLSHTDRDVQIWNLRTG
ncbi:MAG: protein kinase, partial [Chloroflexi bacterium]|nr:protein kinase [Chloroflexota bacterium]